MALPTAYLTSVKNLPGILAALQQAKAPERFTQRFLESLEFKSNSDRLMIGLLKSLRFTDDQGKPTSRYFEYLDQSQSERVMAEAIREAYSDLFQVNTSAQTLGKQDIVNKFKTLSQGSIGESVLDKMAMTFTALVKTADFKAESPMTRRSGEPELEHSDQNDQPSLDNGVVPNSALLKSSKSFGGLHYNIQIILPESRDPKVYDALFRSLHEHLL